MREVTERFKVRGKDGTVYDAKILQDRTDETLLDGTRRTTYSLKEAVLADGRRMNIIDDDIFEIVVTGERLTRSGTKKKS